MSKSSSNGIKFPLESRRIKRPRLSLGIARARSLRVIGRASFTSRLSSIFGFLFLFEDSPKIAPAPTIALAPAKSFEIAPPIFDRAFGFASGVFLLLRLFLFGSSLLSPEVGTGIVLSLLPSFPSFPFPSFPFPSFPFPSFPFPPPPVGTGTFLLGSRFNKSKMLESEVSNSLIRFAKCSLFFLT